MKREILEVLVIFLSFVTLFFLFSSISSSVWSSPSKQFNVTPDEIWLNWTNQFRENITIGVNSSFSSIIVQIVNGTPISTKVTPFYGQSTSGGWCNYLTFLISNASTYTNEIGPLAGGEKSNVSTTFEHIDCSPGRYFGQLYVRNKTNYAENLTINVTVDIPIVTNNTLNLTTGMGNFNGTLPVNATTYHSYYFYINNKTTIENATGISIMISGWSTSTDVDLFLFDGSEQLKAKSIRKSGTSELLNYSFLPSSSTVWEIRLFGNSSTSGINYLGYLIFTTLNVTNTSDQSQQISSLNFGSMNVSDTKRINLTLKNEGNLMLSNVTFSSEVFYVKEFEESGEKNFTFLVPDSSIASKVKVKLNWTGESNYSFELFNQANVLKASSYNKHEYANVTNAMQEEYDETLDTGSSSGFWRLEIKNNSAPTEPFTAKVYIYVNSSKWISTNYTTMTFNKTGFVNSSTNIWVNFTIPEDALNGDYKGSLKFFDERKGTIEIPFSVSVNTPVLLVNNTLKSIVSRIDENYGTNLTRIVYFNLTNMGNYNLSLSFSDSGNLTCSDCNGYNGSFTYNSTSLLEAGTSKIIQVNLTFNSSMPMGIYQGWIYINATNETKKLSSHPYSYFNISLKLNLTNLIQIKILKIMSKNCDNIIGNSSGVFSDENVTLKIMIYYINGTELKEPIPTSNFTSAYLSNYNISWRIPSSGYLNLISWDGSTTPYCTVNCQCNEDVNHYYVNITVPKDNPGGFYHTSIRVNYTKNHKPFEGSGNNGTLIINNTGLFIQAVTPTSLSVNKGSDTYFNATVKNYGPVPSSGVTIKFDDKGCGQITATAINDGCGAKENSYTFSSFSIPYSETCWFRWKIHGDANGTCNAYVEGTPASKWFNNLPVTVTVTQPSTNETVPPIQLPVFVANLTFIQAEKLIIVEQNSSNSTIVIVKNTGNKTQTFNFSVEGINSDWYTINSTFARLLKNKLAAFLVNFSVGLEEIDDYSGKFKINSSEKTETFNFTLRILPGDANKTYINNSLKEYEENMTQLFEKLNQLKAQNLTTDIAEAKLNNLKSKIEEAKNSTAKGDYFHAYQLLSIIKTLIEEAQSEISKLEQITEETTTEGGETGGFQLPQVDWLTVGLIIGGIGGALALAYLFWPTKTGYLIKKKKYVYKPPKKRDIWKSLKEKWTKLNKMKKEKSKESK